MTSHALMQHHDGRIRVWRHRGEDAEHLRYAPPHWSPHRVLWYGAVLDIHFRTLLVRIAGLGHSHISKGIMRPHMAHCPGFFVYLQIDLLLWPARSGSFTDRNMWSMVAQRLTQITHPSCHTRSKALATCETAWSAVPQEHIRLSLNQCRCVWQW
ncbi:transposable element Tcb1 transposase [Trichonephila clavipes]|nr:transposable element Tcb1 transposase [Trichonephila clavipes]